MTVLPADLKLRFEAVRLPARVYWPGAARTDSALIVLLEGEDATAGRASAEALCRTLSAAGAVVLAVAGPAAYECAALGWAAEHAADLGAEPRRLVLAGQHAGAARAARLAIAARDRGWPEVRRQLLVHPRFSAASPMPRVVGGVAPATVVSGCAWGDDGSRYAAHLRAFEIEVDESRRPHAEL
jgi:acetyl esterase/lipase